MVEDLPWEVKSCHNLKRDNFTEHIFHSVNFYEALHFCFERKFYLVKVYDINLLNLPILHHMTPYFNWCRCNAITDHDSWLSCIQEHVVSSNRLVCHYSRHWCYCCKPEWIVRLRFQLSLITLSRMLNFFEMRLWLLSIATPTNQYNKPLKALPQCHMKK